MTIKELRKASGMTQTAFGEYFGIPMRTIQNWESGTSECPRYLSDLVEFKLKSDRKIPQDHNELGGKSVRYDKESAYIAICDYNRCDGKARIIVDNETGVFWADENIVAETADKMYSSMGKILKDFKPIDLTAYIKNFNPNANISNMCAADLVRYAEMLVQE